jgi:hypothetical protein
LTAPPRVDDAQFGGWKRLLSVFENRLAPRSVTPDRS